MKKLILAAIAVACATSVFAQGTVFFQNRIAGTYIQHVYAPDPARPSFSQIGNGANDIAVGATSWAGFPLIGVALAGQYGGQSTLSQILLGAGNNAPEASLIPQPLILSFRTGSGAGWVAGAATITSQGAGLGLGAAATAMMVAWDNSSGKYADWNAAKPAFEAGLIAAGKSQPWNTVLGGAGDPPSVPANLQALSFNLYIVPEPTTFALAGLGIAAMLVFRRRS